MSTAGLIKQSNTPVSRIPLQIQTHVESPKRKGTLQIILRITLPVKHKGRVYKDNRNNVYRRACEARRNLTDYSQRSFRTNK